MTPRATILIPTWNAADTLGAAIASARDQTVTDIEVLVVGDGATAESFEIAHSAARGDDRVRVLELPKGEARGEKNRHAGVLAADAPVIVYLADDDLILPRHVENVLSALEQNDLVQSWNGFIDSANVLRMLPADLADPEWREWHLREPPQNRISITGTAHTVEAYRRLPEGWTVPEPGMPADLTLWRQFLRLPDLRAATLTEMTSLQFPAPERLKMSPQEVAAQRARWEEFLRRPDAHDRLQALVTQALRRDLLELGSFTPRLLSDLRIAVIERDTAYREIDALRATLSWRLTAPLRAVRSRISRRRNGASD